MKYNSAKLSYQQLLSFFLFLLTEPFYIVSMRIGR